MEKELIPVFERDSSLDYLKILKSLVEIPFPVGKKLLLDFVLGNIKNPSIVKNDMFEMYNFGSLKNSKEDVNQMLQSLISNGFIQISGQNNNNFMKVLSITSKGSSELINPSFNENKLKNNLQEETNITDKEKELFNSLESVLKGYNDEQKKAIISDRDKILCLAGAGSGKTNVLTKRVEFLVKYKAVDPKKILAITFTKKAKEEMISRLLNLDVDISVETFNSFCEKTLRKNWSKVYGRPVKMLSYIDKSFAVMEALSSLKKDFRYATDIYFTEFQKKHKSFEDLTNIFINDCFFILDYFKLRGKEIEDFSLNSAESDKEVSKLLYDIAKYLENYMEIQGLRTYDDQILDVLKFFKENKGLIPKFDHILVDEYQDVNSIQIELLDLLEGKNLFCVGDPRQSIFGWRGSDVNHILNFNEKHPDSELIVLKRNYRSKNNIVNFMNFSIENFGFPDLESHENDVGNIVLKEFSSELEEFNFIIDQILHSDFKRHETFVLARTNRQLIEFSNVLKSKNIPHFVKSDDNSKIYPRKGEVILSTIHSIKGLESKCVFVLGCNASNFPSKTSERKVLELIEMDSYDKEEEERRLFYVALSRAKENLTLTYSGSPTYFLNSKMLQLIDKNG